MSHLLIYIFNISIIHPISPKNPTPQYQPIDRKERKGKIEEDYSRDTAAKANK